MYSIYGDTVLDPFWGTGTTSLAAMICGRNSIGYEIEKEFSSLFDERINNAPNISEEINRKRIEAHKKFIKERLANNKKLKHKALNYHFPVTTKQEKHIKLYLIQKSIKEGNRYTVEYEKFDDIEKAIQINFEGFSVK